MEYTLEPKGDKCTIRIAGSMGIADVGEIKNALTSSLSFYTSVTVNMEDVKELDMVIIQLLCSANISFEKDSKILTAVYSDNPAVKSSLIELGYDNKLGCSENPCKTCLWKGGE